MDLKEILLDNYIPYSKGVIVGRAIPSIDGFKPVVRRILYVMHQNKLYNQNKKSQSIVGDTMKLHPNGDSSIYDALIRLTTGNGALNVPYVKSKGNFGRFYSRNISPAAPRYTEARLSEISELLFDGIEENAVDMVPNYDNTTVEPRLLPVKFPNIIVNNTEGIAVAMSSAIPCFGLVEACKAAMGIMDGSITDDEQLADVLKAPEFPTGGSVHIDRHTFMNIIKRGKGSVTLTGTADIYNNKIVITEVPYGVKIEDIIKDINDDQETFKDVSKAVNLTGKDGMKVEVILKRGADANEIYQKIVRHTKFRSNVSFNTSVIMNNRCFNELGIMELLNYWIEFRLNTIKRVYEYRLNKKLNSEITLSVWEKIKDSLSEAVRIIVNETEINAIEQLKAKYGLTVEQANYLMNMPIKNLTADRLASKLKELENLRKEIVETREVVNDPEKRKQISISELKAIIKKFGGEKHTIIKEPIEINRKEPEVISDALVKVVITKHDNIKRVMNPEKEPKTDTQDPVARTIICRNNENLLVFTSTGYCYKIRVNDIDCSRSVPNTYIYSLIEQADNGKIVYVTSSDSDVSEVTALHANGKYDIVSLDRFSGNRKVYKNAFTPEKIPTNVIVTESKEFFVVTDQTRAVFVRVPSIEGTRLVTKHLGKLKFDESIRGLISKNKLLYESSIDYDRYSKGYFVKLRDDLSIKSK